MSRKLSLLAAGVLASFSLAAFAAHNGAGGGHIGGMSAQHMSSKGLGNTNGPEAVDRDKGLSRADDRRNASATIHEHAETAQGEHKKPKVKSR